MLTKEECYKALRYITDLYEELYITRLKESGNHIDDTKEYWLLEQLIEEHFDKKTRQPKVQYAAYDKNDELVCVGNVLECCEQLKITKNTFYALLNKTRHDRFKRGGKYTIFRLEDDDEQINS